MKQSMMCDSFGQTSGLIYRCPNQVSDLMWSRIIPFMRLAESMWFRIINSARVLSLFPLDKVPFMTPVDRFDFFFFFFWQTIRHCTYEQKSPSPYGLDSKTGDLIRASAFRKRSVAEEKKKKPKQKPRKQSSWLHWWRCSFWTWPHTSNHGCVDRWQALALFPHAGPWRPGLPVQPQLCSA